MKPFAAFGHLREASCGPMSNRTTRIRSALGLTYEVMSFRSNRNTAIPMSSAKAIRL